MASEMTIEEAIAHAEEVSCRKCDDCGREHRQLADWLRELVAIRAKLKVSEDALEAIRLDLDYLGCYTAEDIANSALAVIREPVTDRNQLKGGENVQ